jgi:hypothetical protein
MKKTEKPILLTIYELRKPIKNTKNKLNEIFEELKKENLRAITIQGLFVLGISSFEIMISEILTYFLNCIPQKLEMKDVKISKEDLLNVDLVSVFVEKAIISLLYKRFDEILDGFFNLLSIDFKSKDNIVDKLVEMKETRNLLLHNNLVVNNLYLEKTLNYRRATQNNGTLKIDSEYTFNSLLNLLLLVNEIEDGINIKYSNYTKIRVLRDLWDYLFDSPVLKFDDYWLVDEDKDEIISLKHCKYENQISSSERMFLGVWRSHFNNNTEFLNYFNMRTLSSDNQRRMLYFLSIADKISFY